MTEKKTNRIDLTKTFLLMLIILAAGTVIWLLTNRTETHITETIKDEEKNSLACKTSHPDDPFFVAERAQNYTHEVKLLFGDEQIREASYKYESTFSSHELAENALANMHVQYNKYLSESDVNPESYNPVFSTDKTKFRISIYAEMNKFNSAVARLFFINQDEFSKIGSMSIEQLKELYEGKGFSCTIGK